MHPLNKGACCPLFLQSVFVKNMKSKSLLYRCCCNAVPQGRMENHSFYAGLKKFTVPYCCFENSNFKIITTQMIILGNESGHQHSTLVYQSFAIMYVTVIG
jgi:hypothetical protein